MFISCFNSEPKCAAYLGFTDLGGFRRFEFSFHVLEFYMVWGKHCQGRPTIVPLGLIRDLLDDPAECFPANLEKAIEKYGPEAPLRDPKAVAKLQAMELGTNTHHSMATVI